MVWATAGAGIVIAEAVHDEVRIVGAGAADDETGAEAAIGAPRDAGNEEAEVGDGAGILDQLIELEKGEQFGDSAAGVDIDGRGFGRHLDGFRHWPDFEDEGEGRRAVDFDLYDALVQRPEAFLGDGDLVAARRQVGELEGAGGIRGDLAGAVVGGALDGDQGAWQGGAGRVANGAGDDARRDLGDEGSASQEGEAEREYEAPVHAFVVPSSYYLRSVPPSCVAHALVSMPGYCGADPRSAAGPLAGSSFVACA